jgi:large subunit ribosomal protein L22
MLTKLINSGLQIASESEKYDLDNLVIDTIKLTKALLLKEFNQEHKVELSELRKRTSYVTVALKEA